MRVLKEQKAVDNANELAGCESRKKNEERNNKKKLACVCVWERNTDFFNDNPLHCRDNKYASGSLVRRKPPLSTCTQG